MDLITRSFTESIKMFIISIMCMGMLYFVFKLFVWLMGIHMLLLIPVSFIVVFIFNLIINFYLKNAKQNDQVIG